MKESDQEPNILFFERLLMDILLLVSTRMRVRQLGALKNEDTDEPLTKPAGLVVSES
jgi:hypothetical protein